MIKAKKIMILAGEASGDLHGARLVSEVKKQCPHTRFFGMGGTELKAAGAEILVDAAHMAVVGLVEVLAHIRSIRKAMNVLYERMEKERPDLVILIDFPDFNLLMAKRAKWYGIPVLYYISPQVWAWRKGRVKKIGALSDRVAVILPFEKDFYKQYGINADFVGHPLLDSVSINANPHEWRKMNGIPAEEFLVGLLPGSRKKEIASILPAMLNAARSIRKKVDCRFIIPLAPTLSIDELRKYGIDDFKDWLTVIQEDRYESMAACHAVMTASGTATLELAILGTPMMVMYNVSPLTYFIGRLLIHLPYFSLVNLIAGKTIVPELLQKEASCENISRIMLELLCHKEKAKIMRKDLAEVKGLLGVEGASRRVANIILDMI